MKEPTTACEGITGDKIELVTLTSKMTFYADCWIQSRVSTRHSRDFVRVRPAIGKIVASGIIIKVNLVGLVESALTTFKKNNKLKLQLSQRLDNR
jgi:hypothetical protein